MGAAAGHPQPAEPSQVAPDASQQLAEPSGPDQSSAEPVRPVEQATSDPDPVPTQQAQPTVARAAVTEPTLFGTGFGLLDDWQVVESAWGWLMRRPTQLMAWGVSEMVWPQRRLSVPRRSPRPID